MKNNLQTNFATISGNNATNSIATANIADSLIDQMKTVAFNVDSADHISRIWEILNSPIGNDIFHVENEADEERCFEFDHQRSFDEMELVAEAPFDFNTIRQQAKYNAEGGYDPVDLVEGFVLLKDLPYPVAHVWQATRRGHAYVDPVLLTLGFEPDDIKYFPGGYIPESVYYFMDEKLLKSEKFIFPLMKSEAYDAESFMLKALIGCLRFVHNYRESSYEDFPDNFIPEEAWGHVISLSEAMEYLKDED